ncbi:DgyrCDS4083 [Dimorphilus gyrociliatus]|uniref:DgyrCDS4083 n=1 Tax=Dimorphilus gyrociliatus TaxID=2664684 RepID=A0A7I8VFW1_9ANNE|nr:DgyrCDS4083 [Dimorphilus gyrociliatus]
MLALPNNPVGSHVLHKNMPRRTVFPDADSETDAEEENLFDRQELSSDEDEEDEAESAEEGDPTQNDESSDDEAPAEVSKTASKKAASERFANIIEALKTSKKAKKEKRQDRQKLFEKQKEEKRTKLVEALPDGILDGVEEIVEADKLKAQRGEETGKNKEEEEDEEGVESQEVEPKKYIIRVLFLFYSF